MTGLKWAIASAALFGLGALAQVSADLWLAHSRTPIEVAEWSLFRSIAFTAGVLALAGADRLIFRVSANAGRLYRRSLALALLLSVLMATAARALFPVATPLPVLALGIVGASAVLLSMEYFRGRLRLLAAQWAYSGWKIMFLLACLAGAPLLDVLMAPGAYLAALVASFALLPLLANLQQAAPAAGDEGIYPPAEEEDWRLRAVFFFLSVDFVLTIYLDQLLLGAFLEKVLLATYFAHLSLVMSPFLLLTSLLTFLYGAWVRSRPRRDAGSGVALAGWLAVVLGALAAVTMLIAGPLLFPLLYQERYPFTSGVALGLCAAGVLRVLYSVPGSLLTVAATPRELTLMLCGNLSALSLHVVTFVVLVTSGITDGLHATVAALLTNWTVRVVSSTLIMRRTLRRLSQPGPAAA